MQIFLLRPAALAAAYRKICFKIHAAVFRAEVSFKNHLYQSLNDIKVWRLISIFAKLDSFEENGLFEVVYVIFK